MKRTLIIALSVVALVFGVISYASAIDGATTVNATVGTLLEITAPPAASLGTIMPEVPATTNVQVKGKSNRPATMSASVAPGGFTTLTSTTADTVTGLRGGSIAVNYTVEGMVDYNVDPGAVSGTVTYSLVQ